MAREIVITSVPRGVKLGRTGFQVAMQTAGLRDDLSSQLEKMAGYRHLPTGVPNPVCYFHRITKTFAGQMSVLGRIVDAGVDFSNRSNKLAHMVVLETADVGQVAAASPAAVMAAIEGQLASTWPGPPEERQQSFSLAGIPASQAARCTLWQQLMGDAGWAGVLAERAVRGQPTLVIGPDSSPASCRRMLALFQEALAIVPAAKRWSVTFDTTSLSPEGVLWRGTYAGSPESQAAQPGVLVVDLSRPQAIPSNLAAGDLVTIAREGPPRPVVTRPGGVGTESEAPPVPDSRAGNPALTVRQTHPAAGGLGSVPPPTPTRGHDWPGPDGPAGSKGQRKASYRGLIAGLAALGAVFLLGVVGAGCYLVIPRILKAQALNKFHSVATLKDPKSKPDVHDLRWATGITINDMGDTEANAAIAFLNGWLADDDGRELRTKAVSTAEELRKIVTGARSVITGSQQDALDYAKSIEQFFVAADERDRLTVATKNPGGFKSWVELRDAVQGESTRRIQRSAAVKSIEDYAKEPDKSTVPDKQSYCLALDVDQNAMEERYVAFLNDFLQNHNSAALPVVTERDLPTLFRETKAALSDVALGKSRDLDLTVGKDKSVSKLLDGLHSGKFENFNEFYAFVKDLRSLSAEAGKPKDDVRNVQAMSDTLWTAIVAVANGANRLGGDSKGERFVQRVQAADLKDVSALKSAFEGIYSQGSRGGAQSDGRVRGDELGNAVRAFRALVESGNLDCIEKLDKGEPVKLFATSLAGKQEVAYDESATAKTDYISSGPGAVVQIGGDAVLQVDVVGNSEILIKVADPEMWAKHKDAVRFLPIGFAKDISSNIGKGDWIVLSPPKPIILPSKQPTLYDVFFKEDDVQVSLPEGIKAKKGVDLRLASGVVQDPDPSSTLRVEVLADVSGTSGLLTITGTIQTSLIGGQLGAIPYALTERISMASRRVSRASAGWGKRPSRMQLLSKRGQGGPVDVPADKSLIYIGFKNSNSLKDDKALRELDDTMIESVVVATLSDHWQSKLRFKDVEEFRLQWLERVVRDAKPKTLPDWRDFLRVWLAKQRDGFAQKCRSDFGELHPPPEDPGEWVEPQRGQDEKEADFENRRVGSLRSHQKLQGEVSAYKDKQDAYVTGEILKLDALRSYVHECRSRDKNKDGISPEVAAACFLLEIDGLILAKVFREEIETLLKRVPVGVFVEGSQTRTWSKWISGGKAANMAQKVPVLELRLKPAEGLIEPLKGSTTEDTAPAAEGGDSREESKSGLERKVE